jgi:hypothetical protein
MRAELIVMKVMIMVGVKKEKDFRHHDQGKVEKD